MGICSGKSFPLLIPQIPSQVTGPSGGFKGHVSCGICSFGSDAPFLLAESWRGLGSFFSLLVWRCSAAPPPTSARPVQKQGAWCGRLFQMTVLCFPFECVQVSQSPSVSVCMGGDLGRELLQCCGNLTRLGGRLAPRFVCVTSRSPGTWSIFTHFWGTQKSTPLVVIYRPV